MIQLFSGSLRRRLRSSTDRSPLFHGRATPAATGVSVPRRATDVEQFIKTFASSEHYVHSLQNILSLRQPEHYATHWLNSLRVISIHTDWLIYWLTGGQWCTSESWTYSSSRNCVLTHSSLSCARATLSSRPVRRVLQIDHRPPCITPRRSCDQVVLT